MVNKTYLLTGGTGFLGPFLASELLKKGNRIIFLGRSTNSEHIEERIKRSLAEVGYSQKGDIRVVEADIEKKNLGLSESVIINLVGKVDGILHLAANLSFRKVDKKKVFSTNVSALRNIINLAERVKCPIYYISTVYIHGKRYSTILEDELIKPHTFNNYYEESKFEAENILRKWGKTHDNNFVILRLSILIERKIKTLNFFGYYSMVIAIYNLRKSLLNFYQTHRVLSTMFGIKIINGKIKVPVPFLYVKGAYLNLIPIDLAVRLMINVIERPMTEGKTFHIVNPKPFSMEEITKQTFKALDIQIPIIGVSSRIALLYFLLIITVSRLFNTTRPLAAQLQAFKSYMVKHSTYSIKNTESLASENILTLFNFEKNFIEGIARDFIAKLKTRKN